MIKSDKKNEKSSLSKDENFSKEKDTSKKETVEDKLKITEEHSYGAAANIRQ